MDKIKDTVLEVVLAIFPITLVVILLQFTIIGMPMETFLEFLVGVAMVSVGLILFLLGVHIGLLPIGEILGSALPRMGKTWLVVLFGFILGFVATVAEPDVRVLATQLDVVSDGVISKSILILAVALGVAIFVGLGMLRIIRRIPIVHLLLGGYGLVFLLAPFTPAQYVPVSFDAGGVTT